MSKPLAPLEEWWANEDVLALCKYYWDIDLKTNQRKIVRSIAFSHSKRVVISCITRYGKSYCVSMGVLLWIIRNSNKRVALIAPTNEKTSIIRNYIYNFITMSETFSGLVDIEKKGVERIRKEVSRRRMTFKNGVELRTLSAEGKGEQLMGFGADLVVVDEECDIDYEVYRARITRMLGDNSESVYVGIGNPWHRDNQMWQHWINPDWLHIHIDWRIALEEGRISQEFLDEQRNELTAIEFEVLYEANFPSTAPDALIEWNWIERAYTNRPEIPKGKTVIGMDVAEMGLDLTVVTPGIITDDMFYFAFEPEHWGKQETMPTVGRTIPIIEKFNPVHIQVDATGIGSGVHSRLSELKTEGLIKCDVYAFKGGLAPNGLKDKQRFANMKAMAWWYLRKLFEEGKISIPKHRVLIDQLSKMKWEFTSSHKIRIRDPGTKEGDTAEQKSPDFADSLCYMCFEPVRTQHAVLDAFL